MHGLLRAARRIVHSFTRLKLLLSVTFRTPCMLLYVCLPPLQLIQDAQEAHALALSPSGEVSLERFAQLLAMRGQHVWLRTGRLDCAEGQVALRHSFVLAGITATGWAHSTLALNNSKLQQGGVRMHIFGRQQMYSAVCLQRVSMLALTHATHMLLLHTPLAGPSSPSSDHNSSSNPADLSATQLFVVDPAFKEQFALPTSTAQYLNLFEQLPDLFVGTAEQLVPIVELMCTQVPYDGSGMWCAVPWEVIVFGCVDCWWWT